ncbi:hypothetical protein P280DRAFT_520161 [Massarina eburnea CBS 473.64]|uniref:Uncharacterized protein n=1 Tax=Massarina eburnea CBS 473.64 TaxID=1395130 RepID=A0A6A6RT77_9PLEO|nr:hypothetical protein P280DRAFT_520161 [Massarina eburnea CBS 473.64]
MVGFPKGSSAFVRKKKETVWKKMWDKKKEWKEWKEKRAQKAPQNMQGNMGPPPAFQNFQGGGGPTRQPPRNSTAPRPRRGNDNSSSSSGPRPWGQSSNESNTRNPSSTAGPSRATAGRRPQAAAPLRRNAPGSPARFVPPPRRDLPTEANEHLGSGGETRRGVPVRGFEGGTVFASEVVEGGGGDVGGVGKSNGGDGGKGKVPWYAGTTEFGDAKTRRR